MSTARETTTLTPATHPLVTLEAILAAQTRIRGIAAHTPLIAMQPGLWLKAENLQPIGAFKLRGAYNRICQLDSAALRRGVITYSSGNHAQGVAYAARALGARAVVVMPASAPSVKLAQTRAFGAEVVLVGPSSLERKSRAEELAAIHGYTIIEPYDDPGIIAGQGTCGLEILSDMPDVQLVLVPVSGGGLLSGIAAAIKHLKPAVQVWGVEPELAGDALESFYSGSLVQWAAAETVRTIADGLRTQSLGNRNFEHIRRFVDGIISVTEDEIRSATREIALRTHLIAEPSGAVAIAAALYYSDPLPASSRTVAVLSGGNIEPALLAEILSAST